MLSRGQVERTEREMNALTARVHETWSKRRRNHPSWQEWEQATVAFHSYQSEVFALWEKPTLARIRAGERDAMEGALAYLEADAYFYRSGYLKEKVLHAIKHAPWIRDDETRLQMIVLRAIEGRFKREFKFYSRLIPRLRTDEFERELRLVAQRATLNAHRRLVLLALDSHL